MILKAEPAIKQFTHELKACSLIAILRGIMPHEVVEVCDTLLQNGIRLIEVPLNSKDAVESIRIAVNHVGDKGSVGAGTVLTEDAVNKVFESGGRFIISPNTNASVIRRTRQLHMVSIPGISTPSEAFTAIEAGADLLKFFPAGSLGVEYLKNLKAVISKPIIAVGGIGTGNIREFLDNCAAVGVGGMLFKPGKNLNAINKDCRRFADLTKNINLTQTSMKCKKDLTTHSR